MATAMAKGNASVGADAGAMLQLVAFDETFVDDFERRWLRELLPRGRAASKDSLRIVSIMGPQSSGKSTVLNRLFNTNFSTMDDSKGRYQVTQGVWLGVNRDSMVLIDLEGTDSRERGEEAVSFERKSALFALASSEVLIVNLWTQDIGRLNASNLLLLRTVLEQDLVLFLKKGGGAAEGADGAPQKTLLLFLLRDYDSTTALDTLAGMLRTDLQQMWSEITQNTPHDGTPLSELFDLDFHALPHKILLSDEFEKALSRLRQRFEPSAPDTYFRKEYDRHVDADGFPVFAANVWDTIRHNKELDIPAQRELVAMVRCEQIADDVLDTAAQQIKPLAESHVGSRDEAEELCDGLKSVVDGGVRGYDERSQRYAAQAALWRARLRDSLDEKVAAVYAAAVERAAALGVERAGGAFDAVESEESGWRGAAARMSAAKVSATDTVEALLSAARERDVAALVDAAMAPYTRLLEKLHARQRRATDVALRRAEEELRRDFGLQLAAKAPRVLDLGEADVWPKLTALCRQLYRSTEKEAEERWGEGGLALDARRLEEVRLELRQSCQAEALTQLRAALGSPALLLMRAKQCFYEKFRNDPRGLPRVWGPHDLITDSYDQALREVAQLADRLSVVRLGALGAAADDGGITAADGEGSPRGADDAVKVVHFSEEQVKDVKAALDTEARAAYAEAVRSQEQMRAQMVGLQGKLPLWLLAVLVLVGFDDAVWVLSRPVLLLFVLLLGALAYVGYIFNLHILLRQSTRRHMQGVLYRTRVLLDQLAPPPPPPPPPPSAPTASLRSSQLDSPHAHSQ